MSRPARLRIDVKALQHNYARVKAYAPDSAVLAMLKANAYGHGYLPIAKGLPAADAFGVACLEEAVILRNGGISQPIVLMEGVFEFAELLEAADHKCTLVIHCLQQIDMLEKLRVDYQFPVWLKVNTGMHRLGVSEAEMEIAIRRLEALQSVKKPVGLMTHFAEAEVADGLITKHQIDLFKRYTAKHTGPVTLANSAAIMAWKEVHADWVRPGLMLYGASPFPGTTGADYDLQPVMTATSRLIEVYPIQKGARVGYGSTWEAPENLMLGIVGFGYGDGYPQFTSNNMPVLVNGVECELAGRVSMDMLAVDLRRCPDASIGDEVILWGRGLPVEKLAKHANTSAYEVLTRVTNRPKIEIVGEK